VPNRIAATTTQEGFKKMQERDANILRKFSTIILEAPSVEQAMEIIRGVAERYERHHRVQVSEGAIGAAVQLAKRYLSDRALPDTAVDLLDETASRKRVEFDGVERLAAADRNRGDARREAYAERVAERQSQH
jgi:ATP-dependent Clp protease ATP-binding subunit ClpB